MFVALSLALLGTIIGSFVGALVLRLPAGRSVVAGRSSCDQCGTILSAAELLPLLSYAWQRGRCRHCHSVIAIEQPLAEAGCAVVGVLAVLSADNPTSILGFALFGWGMMATALLDARHYWLPDALTLSLLVAGIGAALFQPETAPIDRIAGAVLGYALLEATRWLYRSFRGREGMGGGDAKLFAAIGAWLGAEALPWVMLLAGVLGLLHVVFRMMRGRALSRYDRLPLGTLLSVATILLFPWSASLG